MVVWQFTEEKATWLDQSLCAFSVSFLFNFNKTFYTKTAYDNKLVYFLHVVFGGV